MRRIYVLGIVSLLRGSGRRLQAKTHVVLSALAVLASHTSRTRLQGHSVSLLMSGHLRADWSMKKL
jgi:hypothetical protein